MIKMRIVYEPNKNELEPYHVEYRLGMFEPWLQAYPRYDWSRENNHHHCYFSDLEKAKSHALDFYEELVEIRKRAKEKKAERKKLSKLKKIVWRHP